MENQDLIPITNQLFKYLLANRQAVIAKKQGCGDVKSMLNQLLKDKQYAYSYANHMRKTNFKQPFLKLLYLDPKISHSEYVSSLEQIYKSVIAQINDLIQNPQISQSKLTQMFVKLTQGQIVLQNIMQSNLPNIKIDPIPNQPKPDVMKKFQPKKEQPVKSKQSQKKKQQIQKSNNKQQSQKKKQYIQKSNNKQGIKQQVDLKKNNPQQKYKAEEIKFINQSKIIKGKDVSIVIRYFERNVDIDYKYQYQQKKFYVLLDQLKIMVTKYLKDNVVALKRRSTELRILDDTNYVKSADAGNYFFDPFFNSVQIKIKRKDNKEFDTDFKVQQLNDSIFQKPTKVQKIEQWNKVFMKLTPKNNVRQLVQYIGQKRQVQKNIIDGLAEGLKKKGGAQTIQDLFNWSISQYDHLNVQATWTHEIRQTIELIKDCNRIGNQKQYDIDKRKCLKVANSHKILRYLVFKNQQSIGIKKLPWLNLQNVRNAINLVRKQFHNDQLLDQLNGYFQQFALDPKGNPIPFSRGLVLFGPPGTGKTVLTETMPEIMGFHLIEKGLSAADFMKSLQGQSSRMIRDLTNRANQSPYLLCSVGIDEVDGLVPDRKDKDEKNKGEGISMLLSVIGGNKDVSNLVFMTSTNYLKKIDQAIRRRLSGQFQVGRPNPQARQKILVQSVEYLKQNKQLLTRLIQITTNFTGAALKGIGNALNKILSIKGMEKKPKVLTQDQVTQTAALMARQFSITLGIYTLPQIYKMQRNKKNILTKQFLSRVHNNFAIVQDTDTGRQNILKIIYLQKISRYINGKLEDFYEAEQQDFDLSIMGVQKAAALPYFKKYLETIFQKQNIRTIDPKILRQNSKQEIRKYISSFRKHDKSRLIFVEDWQNKQKQISILAKTIFSNKKQFRADIYSIFYLPPAFDRQELCKHIFGKFDEQLLNKVKYSGRIFVQLNNEARLAFQLNSTKEQQSKIAFKLYLKTQQTNLPKDVIPQLVKFFTRQQVSYILLLDYEMLLQNDAFEQKKMLEIMEQKMSQAKNYQRVAVMINIDSLITMSQNASDSSFGRSMSYSVVNHNMYQILLNYMRQFAMVDDKYSRWISVIAKNQQIVKKVKKDLDWPIYPEERKKQEEQKQKDAEKVCIRCGQWYTERKNKQQRTCMQHPGKIVDMLQGQFEEVIDPLQLKAKLLTQKQKKKQNDKQKDKIQDRYRYTCCLGNLSEQGHKGYYHIEQNQLGTQQDQLQVERIKNYDKADTMRKKMGKFRK